MLQNLFLPPSPNDIVVKLGIRIVHMYIGSKTKLQVAKTAPRQKLLAELHTKTTTYSKNTPKTHASGSPPPDPHGAARPSAATLWRTPAKLMGDLALPLLDTPIEAHRAIFIIFNE
jgi:hypothetical protein